MKVFLDTSVLFAALLKQHLSHTACVQWLQKVISHHVDAALACHSLAELYSTITRYPTQPRASGSFTWNLIARNVLLHCELIELTKEDYITVLESNAVNEIIGGTTYDALIAHAFMKSGADYLLTLNLKHFRRILPAHADRILAPDEAVRLLIND
jgi:predicted nucleic acid-binding protein